MRVKYNGNNTKDLNTISDNNHTPRSFSERWGAFKKVVKKVAMFMLMIEGVNMAPVGGTFVEKNFGLVYAQTTKEEQKVLKNFYDLYKKIAGLEPIKNTGFINVDAEHGKNLISLVEKMGFTKKDDGIYYGDKLVYKFMEVKIEGIGTFKAIQIFDPKTKEKIFFSAIAAAYNAGQVQSAVEEANKKLAEAKEVPQPPLVPLVPAKTGEKQEPRPADRQIVAEKVVPQPLAQKGAEELDLTEELDLKKVKDFVEYLGRLKKRLEYDYGKILDKDFLNNYNKLSQLLKKSKIDNQKVMEYVDGLAEFLLQDSPSLDVYNKLDDPNNKIKMLSDHIQMIGHILEEGIYHPIENPQDAQLTKINLKDLKKYTKDCNLVLDGGKTKVPLLSVVGARLWFALINDESLRRHLDEEAKPLFKEKFDKKDEKYKEIFNKIVDIEKLRFKYTKGLISQEEFVLEAFKIAKQYGDEAIKKLAENTEDGSKKYDIIQKKLPTAAYTLLSMTELKLLIDLQKERKVAYDNDAVMFLDYAKDQYLWTFTENITKPEYKPPAYFNDNVPLIMANLGINKISTYFADFYALIYRHYPQKKEEPPLKEMVFYVLENSLKYPFILKGLQTGSYNYLKRDVGGPDDVVVGSFFTNVISPNDKRFEPFIGGAHQSFWPSLIEYNNQKYNPYIGDYFVSEYVTKYHPDKFMTPVADNLILLNHVPEFNEFKSLALSNLKNSRVFGSLVNERNIFSGQLYPPCWLLYSPPKEIKKPDDEKKEPPPPPPKSYPSPEPIRVDIEEIIKVPPGEGHYYSDVGTLGPDFYRSHDLPQPKGGSRPTEDAILDYLNGASVSDLKKKYNLTDNQVTTIENIVKSGDLANYLGGSNLNIYKYRIEKDGSVRVNTMLGADVTLHFGKSQKEVEDLINKYGFGLFTGIITNVVYSSQKIAAKVYEIPYGKGEEKTYKGTLENKELEVRSRLGVLATRYFKLNIDVDVEVDWTKLDEIKTRAKEPLTFKDAYGALKKVGVNLSIPITENLTVDLSGGKYNLITGSGKGIEYDPGNSYAEAFISYTWTFKDSWLKNLEVYSGAVTIWRSGLLPKTYILSSGVGGVADLSKGNYISTTIGSSVDIMNTNVDIGATILYHNEFLKKYGISGAGVESKVDLNGNFQVLFKLNIGKTW